MFCSNCGFPLESGVSNCPLCEASTELTWRNSSPFVLLQGTPLHNASYRIGRVLAKDSFEITYLGCAPASQRLIVIKEFFPDSSRRDEAQVVPAHTDSDTFMRCKEQFLEAAYELASFKTPEIVGVLTFFEANDSAYLVTKYLSNPTTLREKLEATTKLTEAEALPLITRIANALRMVHEKNILHLDLNPENILVSGTNEIILPNLGLSKKLWATAEYGTWNFEDCPPSGTSGYAAPEQHRRDSANELSEATDIYALGAIFYELLTGTAPTDAQTRGHGNDLLPSPRQLEPSISEAIESVVLAALKLKQNFRPQTVADFLALLAAAQTPILETEGDDPSLPDDGTVASALTEVEARATTKRLVPEIRISLQALNAIEYISGISLVLLLLSLVWMRLDATRRDAIAASHALAEGSRSTSSTTQATVISAVRTVAPTPVPKHFLFKSVGTWQGTYDGTPATLVITERNDDTSLGVLTSANRNGIFQVAITIKEGGSRRLSAQETQALYEPSDMHWRLAASSGTFAADSAKMSGPGYKLGGIPGWSFTKTSATAQVPVISDEATPATSNMQGNWRGKFADTDVTLTVDKQKGDYFHGFLTSAPSTPSPLKIALSGYLVPATRAVVMTETNVISGSWSLQQSTGSISASGSMSGTRTGSRAGTDSWRLTQTNAG